MAGSEPIPENPLIRTDDFPTTATQKPVPPGIESAQQATEIEIAPTEKTTTEDNQLENSTVLVIPLEDQDAIRNIRDMTGVEEDAKTEVAVEITLPDPQEGEASGEGPATPVAEPTATETPATPEARLPTPPLEENTPSITPTETRGEEPQPEAEAQAPEPTPAPGPTETEQAPVAPVVLQNRSRIPFRKICATCEALESRCYATSCLACGDDFVLIYEDEADNEEARAKLTEEKRPDCNPGDGTSAYCKSCLLDWFDNCIAWPHRETLPQHEGESVLHLVVPFVSEAYMQRLKDIQEYWDDKEKIFCPAPTCSAYIPRTAYTVTKEETVTRTVTKPAQPKEETATVPETEEQSAETTVEAAPEPAAPVNAETTVETNGEANADANVETNAETNATTNGEATAETNGEANVEATVEANAGTDTNLPAAEPATEEKEEKPVPEPEPQTETITEIVKKEYKTRLAICSSPACRTPVCTLCRSHFHGLDTPCASRTYFFKEFMLSKYTKEQKEGGEDNENGEQTEENYESEDEYDEDGDYEEYPNRYRQCVNCQNLVARHTGCDHMTCACGAAFCFDCGGEYGPYHSCISNKDYLAGDGVGGIKITTENGFFDDEGAAVVVNPLGVIEKEEEAANIEKWLDVVEFTEDDEVKKFWKVKAGVEIGPAKTELVFSEDENVRLAKPTKDWKGKNY
ncbi:uncharacterized protein DFL_001515 [Arthrobotrys flagrans]|uniref:IBR domain-containing protein n=1 Tax=Arthrobotrys flagrans TaxID=97331 RepID=A0A437A7T8_ARTFL|nr:hypothetical protein DFL_001515 [Arthrobotrys flagrans]